MKCKELANGVYSTVFLLLALLLPISLSAQTITAGPVVSAGYRIHSPVPVSPGQVITLFLYTATPQLSAPAVASTTPLPSSLAGFSIQLFQTFSDPISVPLLAVYPVDNCYGLYPLACANLTALTIQIPRELAPNIPRAGRPSNFAVLRVTVGGTSGDGIPLNAVTDDIHVQNTCDASAIPSTAAGPCQAVVKHADGSLVNLTNPAVTGALLTVPAYGMRRSPH